MTDTRISPELIRAYEATEYRVLEPVPFTLKVGQRSRELERLYERTGTRTAAVITAWNPCSEERSDAENHTAHENLAGDLKLIGLQHLPALGADPKDKWKGEESFLVLDAPRETAERLGRKYGLNCIVWAEANAAPVLLFLR